MKEIFKIIAKRLTKKQSQMATLKAVGRDLGSYCPGNWCRWNAQTEKKESAWFWPLNWKSEWQTLTLWLYSLIKVSLFWPYYGSLKGFQSNPCRLAATKSTDAFDVHGTVPSEQVSKSATVASKSMTFYGNWFVGLAGHIKESLIRVWNYLTCVL